MDPKYKQIYETMKRKIITGVYKEKERIPDEITLCQEYNCSRMTMKKAMDLLVQEGYIVRKKRIGSFVMIQPKQRQRIQVSERELSGLSRSGKVQSDVLEFKLEFASKEIADNLGIEEKAPIYSIHRLRKLDGQPLVLEQTYMAPETIPGLTIETLHKSIYEYIEKDLGLKIGSAKKITRADKSNEMDQRYLHLSETEPVIEIEQIAYLDNGIPFEYSISRHRYDKFEFSIYSIRY